MKFYITIFILLISITSCADKNQSKTEVETPKKLKALIIDGQNNHGVWPKTTMMMRDYLEDTGLFNVAIYRSKYTYQGPHHGTVDGLEHDAITNLVAKYDIEDGRTHVVKDAIVVDTSFHPDFAAYDVIVSNFGWQSSELPEKTKSDFENYMESGGGLVIVHAANNAWGDWTEFNQMIGLGGWGDRGLSDGYQVYYNDEGDLKRTPADGNESSHGPEVKFLLTTRAPEHPIMKGLPEQWLHSKDELYDRLRGPAENLTVLATAYADVEENAQPWALENKGSGRHEPMLMVVHYGKGRVFHTTLGHMDYSMEGVGFMTTFQRGAEWVATGKVTQEIPEDFPDMKIATSRTWSFDDQ